MRLSQRLLGFFRATSPEELLALCRPAAPLPEGFASARLDCRVRFAHQGIEGRLAIQLAPGDRMRYEADLDILGSVLAVLGGERGWEQHEGAPPTELTGALLEQEHYESPLFFAGDWPSRFESLERTATKTFEGQEVHVLHATPHEAPPLTLQVDADTGRVLRREGFLLVEAGVQLPVEARYEDYRERDGLWLPHRIVEDIAGLGRVVIELESVEWGVEHPAGTFAEPAAASDDG